MGENNHLLFQETKISKNYFKIDLDIEGISGRLEMGKDIVSV